MMITHIFAALIQAKQVVYKCTYLNGYGTPHPLRFMVIPLLTVVTVIVFQSFM